MAAIANVVFNRFARGEGAGVTGPEVLIGVYAFALQIYGDFSGYSSIARGVSKWLGYELVVNFRMSAPSSLRVSHLPPLPHVATPGALAWPPSPRCHHTLEAREENCNETPGLHPD